MDLDPCYRSDRMSHDRAVMTGIFSKNGVSLERLQTLSEVVQAGSYSIAAKSDPTRATLISRQMTEMEEALGISLFDKSKKPYQPSAAALHLAATCERFVGTLHPITVGAGELVIRELLVPWIGRQRRNAMTNPWVMRNLKWRKIQESLAAELLDVGMADGLESNGNVEVAELETYGYKLVLADGQTPDKSGWKRLAETPVVLLDGAGRFRRHLADCEREHGFTLRIGTECTTYPQAVAAGYAVFVPEYWWRRRKEWQSRTQVLPGLEKLRRTLKLGWNRKIAEHRPEVAKLVDALRKPKMSDK